LELSVVIPAFNEQDNIARTVRAGVEVLSRLFSRFEILIIDDASTDATGRLAEELAAEVDQVRVVHNPVNAGQGVGQLRGFARARYELVTHNGMDAPFDFADLPKMTSLLAEADVVVAARTSRPGYTPYRRVVSLANLLMLNTLFGLRLHDYNFVQLYRKQVLQAVMPYVEATSAGFVVPEILIRARDMGFRIRQVDIAYHRRRAGRATVGRPRVVWRSFCEQVGFWLRRAGLHGQRPDGGPPRGREPT
jgi:glycosyltransferase involved in cell wall biosynthesis